MKGVAEKYPGDTEAWHEVLTKTYSLPCYEISRFKFYQGNELGGRKYIAVAPFLTDSACYANVTAEEVENLSDEFKHLGVEYGLIKSRHSDLSQLSDSFITEYSYRTFVLDLTSGSEFIWKNVLKGKTRNQVRKGLKQNVLACWGGTELLEDFYSVISRAWRDLGTPTHSLSFYRNILLHFGGRSELLVIYMNGVAVSAAICIVEGTTLYHPFAATIRSMRGSSVNNVLYWKIIERGCDLGLKTFDLGRSHENQGTYRFKLSWGAKPIPLYYNYWQKGSSKKVPVLDTTFYRMSCAVWKRVPLWVANRFGPHLIRKVL